MRLLLLTTLLALLAACSEASPDLMDETSAVPERRIIQDRFRVYESELGHGGTLSNLLRSLDRRDLSVFAMIDHQAGAASVDMELTPMTLVIFGSPRAGTPLIAEEPLMGIELPLRALIFEEDGETKLAITGVDYLEREYALESRQGVLNRMSDMLESLATEATTP